eukprot:6204399-Amphidinium_carterae.1
MARSEVQGLCNRLLCSAAILTLQEDEIDEHAKPLNKWQWLCYEHWDKPWMQQQAASRRPSPNLPTGELSAPYDNPQTLPRSERVVRLSDF